jgi:hypothetical protein
MIATAHVTAGMIAGVVALRARGDVLRVATAFGLGVLSHVLLDTIPHSDYGQLARWTILIIVSVELLLTFALGWYLLRPLRLRGLHLTLPAGVAGGAIPDAKFAGQWLPAPAASWVRDVGDRFHSFFHVDPTPIAVGLAAELTCALILIAGLWAIARRYDPDQNQGFDPGWVERRAQDSTL